MKKPYQLTSVDLNELRWICHEYLDHMENDYNADIAHNYKHRIYETALKAIYGDKVFDFVNDKIQ